PWRSREARRAWQGARASRPWLLLAICSSRQPASLSDRPRQRRVRHRRMRARCLAPCGPGRRPRSSYVEQPEKLVARILRQAERLERALAAHEILAEDGAG